MNGTTKEFREARKTLANIGMTIKRNEENEYIVNFKGANAKTEYFTEYLDDAVATAQKMRADDYARISATAHKLLSTDEARAIRERASALSFDVVVFDNNNKEVNHSQYFKTLPEAGVWVCNNLKDQQRADVLHNRFVSLRYRRENGLLSLVWEA